MRMLVTGALGFVGRHLTEHLLTCDHEVLKIVHPAEYMEAVAFYSEDNVVGCDLLDHSKLAAIVEELQPDAIFHLAAFSNPEGSLTYTRKTLETNVIGTQNLLASAHQMNDVPRVLLIGSAQQYGRVSEEDQPISEDCLQKPLTPYAVSKSSQELLGQRYFLSEDLPVYWTRSFNHTGPGQSDMYVCPSFARQIVEVEKGVREPEIVVGNLDAQRDFTDVRDVARAYVEIIENGVPGRAYNVCSGVAISTRQILETLIELSGVDVEVRIDPTKFHTLDAPLIVGNPERLCNEVRWTPVFSIRDTLQDLLADCRLRS